MKPTALLRRFLAIAGSAALTIAYTQATTLYWDVDGSGVAGFGTVVGTWNTTNNFWNTDVAGSTGGSVTNTTTSADDLIIKQATVNTGSITVTGTQNASSITFAANVGSTALITGGAITIGGTGASSGIFQQSSGANTIATALTLKSDISAFNFSNSSSGLLTIGAVTGAATSGTQTITIGASSTGGITLGGVIGNGANGGKVGLTINSSGAGETILSGNNSFTGQLKIERGVLSIASINNASGNGTLGFGDLNLPVILGSSGGNTGTLRYTGVTATPSSDKSFTLAAGGTGVFQIDNAGTALSLSGQITGSGNLLKTGAGTLTLNMTTDNYYKGIQNQFTGVTQITGGKIKLVNLYNFTGYGAMLGLQKSVFDTTGTSASVGLDVTKTQANVVTSTLWLGGLAGNVDLATAATTGYTGATGVSGVVLSPQSGTTASYSGVIGNGFTTTYLTKAGPGSQTFTTAQTYTGATTLYAGTLALSGTSGSALTSAFTVSGGTVELDNSGGTFISRLNDATALSLGSLTLKSYNGAGVQTETVGATTFAVGGKVTINNGTTVGDQTTLAMGAVTRSAGAAIDFVGINGTLGSVGDTPNVTSTGAFPGTVNGILPWATVGGTQWAEDNANSIRAYSGSFNTDLTTATNSQNAQTTGSLALGAAAVGNSLNLITSGAGESLSLGTNNLTLGSAAGSAAAILKSGVDAYTISGTSGQLRAGSAGAGTELIAHVNGGALTISAPLATAILGIAKGGTGNLILSGTRATTMSGAISIAGGELEFQGLTTTLSGAMTGSGKLVANLNSGQVLTMSNTANSFSGGILVKGGVLKSADGTPTISTAAGHYTGNGGMVSFGGLSNIEINGGVFYYSYMFGRHLGTDPDQIQITGGVSGFSTQGQAIQFTGNNNYEVVWGSDYFKPTTLVLNDAVAAAAAITFANKLDLNGATRTVTTDSASFGATFSNVIRTSSGTAGLTKTGVGTLTLSAVNTYNGNTTVNQGTLLATQATALPGYNSAGKVIFNGGTVAVRVGGSGWTTAQVDTLLSNATKTSGVFGIDTTNGGTAQWTAFTTGNFSSLGLTKTGSNTLLLNQTNTYTGGTTISGGTLIFQKLVSMPASGVVAVQTGGTIGIGLGGVGEWTTGVSGEGTLAGLLAGLGGQVGSTVSYTGNVGLDLVTTGTQSYGVLANVGTSLALTKSGYGSLALTAANTYTGASSLNNGTLILDYASTDDTKLANAAALNLNGGTLNLQGGGHLELVSATNLNAGHTAITRNLGTAKLRMNALTRANGGTISFADATIADTDRVNTNGILGGYATLGNDWAINSTNVGDGTVTALAAYTGALPSIAGGLAADNDTLAGGQTQAGATAANTVKITNSANSQSLNLDAFNLTITSTGATTLGGILYAGGSDNLYSITGTTGRIVPSGGNQEIIFAVNTGTLSVSAFVGVSNSFDGVTKFGAGKLVLSAGNNYRSATRVNEGTLAWGANNVFRDDSPFVIGSATLDASTFDDTVGNLDVTANATINLGAGANLAFAASNAVDWTGGTLNLTGTLDFSGTVTSSLKFGTSATGLTASQLASITSTGWTNFALNASGYLTATLSGGNTFATWIAGFSVGGQTGINDDFDNDDLGNAVENLMGTNPSVFNQGLTAVSSTGGNLKFRHTLSTTPASDLTGAYEWSVNLSNWNADGATSGGTTVSFGAPVIITPGTPNLVEVTASVSGTPSSKIFARFKATQ